jgi:hypothetical protein
VIEELRILDCSHFESLSGEQSVLLRVQLTTREESLVEDLTCVNSFIISLNFFVTTKVVERTE